MSPHAVNSLVSDLVSMAKAVEELPLVREALEKSQHEARDYADLVHNREAEIASLRKQIADMSTKINLAEVARDDAELRFLELEERVGKLTRSFTVALEAMDMADAVATELEESMKPKPIPANDTSPMQAEGEAHSQPEGTAHNDNPSPSDATQGQRATDPTADGSWQNTEPRSAPTPNAETPENVNAVHGEGVSVPTDPTASPKASLTTESPSASLGTATKPEDAASLPDPAKPYLGKFYRDVPGYVSFAAWINGGGREGDYYIR